MENCVICSHLSLILQAVIPPASSSLIYSNKLRWDEFFPCFLCIACLSSLVSQQSFFYHPFFLPSYWICSLLSFPYRFLLFVPNLSSLLSAGCCCGSDLSGSGRAKKADKSSTAWLRWQIRSYRLWGWDLNIQWGKVASRKKGRMLG